MDDTVLVFVYGTLRKHEANHYLLEGAKCLAEQSWTYGELYDTGEGYPAMKCSVRNKVYGELYSMNEEQLRTLDQLEDYAGPGKDNLYDRHKQTVYTDIGSHNAYVYTISPDHENLLRNKIDLGDWKIYHSFKQTPTFFYFAYGSCMDHERFNLDHVADYFQNVSGVGILDGYQLRYTRMVSDGGRADIVEEGGVVEGIVYEVPEEALSYLYRREGVKYKSYRPALIDVKIEGQLKKNVLTFIVVNKDKETAPPLDYAIEIIRGGSGFLSESYINKLKRQLKEQFNLIL